MKCPGQDTQYWNADAIFETQCPECGHVMEFFKDDATRRCPGCKKKIVNPNMDFGCAAYCKFAEQCLGTLPEEFVAAREDLFKDRVAVAVKKHLGTDFKRIGHAARVAGFAEKIGKAEKAALPVVLCAAYLAVVVEKENDPAAAERLLQALGAGPELISAVASLLEKPDKPDTSLEAQVLADAGNLAHMAACDGKQDLDKAVLTARLGRIFITPGGKKLARQVLAGTTV